MATDNVIEVGGGAKAFTPQAEAAFLGLLRGHAEVTHALSDRLVREHGLGLSAYEVLSRLTTVDCLRVSELAEHTRLSVSRVSRLVDELTRRGLLRRSSCSTDSRVVYVVLEDAGRELAREAQETFFEVVDASFVGRLSCAEVEILGGLLSRLYEPSAPDGA